MKFKFVLAAVLVAGLTASLAVAAPAKTSKKPARTNTPTTTAKKAKKVCRPNVSLILRGNLVSVDVDGALFTMDVKQTNRLGKRLDYKGQTVSVRVDANTKIRRLGKKVTLDKLVAGETNGDTLNVRARVCKTKTSTGEAKKKWTWTTEPAWPLAVRVVAKPAKAAPTTS